MTSLFAFALTLAAGSAHAATLTTLQRYLGGLGNDALTLGPDGQLYGTASAGAKSDGIVFKISTTGVFTTLASLDRATSGRGSLGGVVFDGAGNLFGVGDDASGVSAKGTVFKLTPTGTLSRFATLDRLTVPAAGLTIDGSGTIYGVTAEASLSMAGTAFKVTAAGVPSTLVQFNNVNGASPSGQLTLDAAGNIYGVTQWSAVGFSQYSNGFGTIFKISNTGVFTTLVQFDGLNGSMPHGKLAIDGSGNLYGTTSANSIFKVTSGGVITTLATFNGINGLGVGPRGGLLIDAAGNLFGTTIGGGDTVFGLNKGVGTVFEYTAAGVLKTLATFDGSNGESPYAGLTADAAGNLYGTTNNGTIFKLGDTGFVPFTAGVPEPASWALLLTGFGLTGAAMRRRSPVSIVAS